MDAIRQLEPGRDFSPRPLQKLIRARILTEELLVDLNDYRQSLGTETVSKYSEDRREVTFYSRIRHEPPLDRWALTFGDIVHNYRAALDGLAWELAKLDGGVPAEPHRLYFPIFQEQSKWERASTTTLSSIPPDILDRLERVQPYHADPVELGIGVTLHRLDIEDKHRSDLRLELRPMDKVSYAMRCKYVGPVPVTELGDQAEWLAPAITIADNMPIVRVRSRLQFEEAGIDKLPLVLRIIDEGRDEPALEILRLADRQVAATFEIACTGALGPEGRWLSSLGI